LKLTGPTGEARLAIVADGLHEAAGNTLLFKGRYREAVSEYQKEV
jgi:hypothetical protein